MKRLAAPLLAVLVATSPAAAGDGDDEMREGLDMLRQGTELLLRGLMDELGPALLELQGQIIDLSLYELPEILPNGDIIIRRKPTVAEPQEDEIDL